MESVTPATPALKRWSIRRYYTYMDEYYVEAPSLTEAMRLLSWQGTITPAAIRNPARRTGP